MTFNQTNYIFVMFGKQSDQTFETFITVEELVICLQLPRLKLKFNRRISYSMVFHISASYYYLA